MSRNSESNAYDLRCTDCAYETTVEGTFLDALDVADAHQDEHGHTPAEHFVDLALRSGDAPRTGSD